MASRASNYVRDDADNVVTVNFAARKRPLRQLAGRSLRTLLSDDQLDQHGLSVYMRADDGNLWLGESPWDRGAPARAKPQEWLVETLTNVAQEEGEEPNWLVELAHRVDHLHQIAVDEDLPFSEDSREAALKFAAGLRRARHPSTFLVGNGNVRLLWVNGANEQVGLQFRDSEQVQFVLFKSREERLAHTMGNDTPLGVLQTIAAMGLMHVLEG